MDRFQLSGAPTRRAFVAGIAASFGAMAARNASAQMQEKAAEPSHAALTAIHYDLDFNVAPRRIYSALLDAGQFAAFTGMAAEIEARPGGAFRLFGRLVEGRNIELVENQRVVQAWRPAAWQSGIYSIVHFELRERGTGSALAFDHAGFAAGLYDHLDAGWQSHYWDPMKKYFAA